jgi:hypothetical protein
MQTAAQGIFRGHWTAGYPGQPHAVNTGAPLKNCLRYIPTSGHTECTDGVASLGQRSLLQRQGQACEFQFAKRAKAQSL